MSSFNILTHYYHKKYMFLFCFQVAKGETVAKVTAWEQMALFAPTAASQLSRAMDKPAPSGMLLLLHVCHVL